MTWNQTHAVDLARNIVEGRLKAHQLSDNDWALLMLASGLTNPRSLPLLVSHRVLKNRQAGDGYFAGGSAVGRRREPVPAGG